MVLMNSIPKQCHIKIILLLSSLISLASSSIIASIQSEIEGEGFHRILKYYVNTGVFKNQSCHVAVFLQLPSSLYVNINELADLRRVHKTSSCADGEIDVELFAEKAKPQNVSICTRLISTRLTLSVPIHQRYQFPSHTGDPVNLTIPKAKLLIGCKDKLKGYRVSKIKLCRPCLEYSKKWRDIPYEWENAKEFIWKVPVGNTSHSLCVTVVTLFVTISGAIFVLWSVWESYKERIRETLDTKIKND